MTPVLPYRAEELLDKGKEELQAIRGSLFKGGKFSGKSIELQRALLDVCVMYSLVQDMQQWRRLAEPGIAGLMMGDDDADEKTLDEARELDRHSIEAHSEVSDEFERLGGKAEFQARIERLNELATKEEVPYTAPRKWDFDEEDEDD